MSSFSTVFTGALGVSFACLGFLNGLLTVFKGSLERAVHVLALDCHAHFSISNSTTQTKDKKRDTTRQGRGRQGQGQGGEKERSGWGKLFLKFERKSGRFFKTALFPTISIRFPWTNLFKKTYNFETIEKIHNFARQLLQQQQIDVLCMLLNILSVYDTKQL
jgi:hypothetical protein